MDYTESVSQSIDYINAHLNENLTAEKIAANAGYSVFHFCRIFKEYSGKSLMRFVRERRLENAEREVEDGHRLCEIACKYGFETASGFSRAYEKKFGERPAKIANA